MKDAAIVCTAVLVGVGLLYLVVLILPVVIATVFIILIYWMVAKFLVGGFSPWPPDRE